MTHRRLGQFIEGSIKANPRFDDVKPDTQAAEEGKLPWWYPKRADEDYCANIRETYEDAEDLDDETIREEYAHGEFEMLWDHLGDAREAYEPLAEAFLAQEAELSRLRRELAEARSEIVELSERLRRTVAVANERDALRGELAAKKEQFDALRKAVFDECTMADKERIQSRYTVLVQIEKDQQS